MWWLQLLKDLQETHEPRKQAGFFDGTLTNKFGRETRIELKVLFSSPAQITLGGDFIKEINDEQRTAIAIG